MKYVGECIVRASVSYYSLTSILAHPRRPNNVHICICAQTQNANCKQACESHSELQMDLTVSIHNSHTSKPLLTKSTVIVTVRSDFGWDEQFVNDLRV